MRRQEYSQDGIENNIREEHNALDKDEADTNCEGLAMCLPTTEELMIHNSNLRAFPFIDAECNQDDNSYDESRKGTRVDPGVEVSSKIETGQK